MRGRPKYTPLDRECDASTVKRASLVLFLIVLAFCSISARLFYIQLTDKGRLTQQAGPKRLKKEDIPAPKGAIYDANNHVLACDQMVQTVVFDNVFLNEKKSKGAMDHLAQSLAISEQRPMTDIRRSWNETELKQRYLTWVATLIAPALQKSPTAICSLINGRTDRRGEPLPCDEGETILAKEINATQSGMLKKILAENSLRCLRINSFYTRSYPNSRDLTPIVGLVNSVGKAVSGVELGRQRELTGELGWREYEVDAAGREVTAFEEKMELPVPGKSLRLTLDTTLQEIVEATLDEVGSDKDEVYVPNLNLCRAMIVLLDAETMAIRAMACRKAKHNPGDPILVNAAVEEVYEPGSTIKIITMASTLDCGAYSANSKVTINGPYYNDADIEPIHDSVTHASLTPKEILVHSSNIGSWKLARACGIKRFQDYVRSFGLGERSAILGYDEKSKQVLGRETAGIVHKNWDLNMLARASFGYNIAVTPVQMGAALGVILNDGWYKRPYLVEAVLDDRNRVLEEHKPIGIKRVISANAARQTREAMFEVVERGTGTRAQSAEYYFGGKTGTARKAGASGYETGNYVVSFLGFAPVLNPKLIGIVVLDTPSGASQTLYGGKLAAPVFRRIMERALRYYKVPVELVTHKAKPTRRP